jgi:hypothetical protein
MVNLEKEKKKTILKDPRNINCRIQAVEFKLKNSM